MTTRKRPTLAELESNIEKEASWAEKNFGPQVTGRLTKPGRPAKGVVIEPTPPPLTSGPRQHLAGALLQSADGRSFR